MKRFLAAAIAVAGLVGLTGTPALANPVTGPVYTYTADNPATIHNTGAPFTLDLSINGVIYQDRATWLQAQENGATMWGGPNVPKSQTQWRVCWYVINPQTQPATVRLDVLIDGISLSYGDVTLSPFAHAAGDPYHVSPICTSLLFPFAPQKTQIRIRVLQQEPNNFVGGYKTTLQQEVYP